jgi:hyperosmotically inducible protein
MLTTACGRARPYRAMVKAATSEENVGSQAQDHRLKASMREAILAADPQGVLAVTPYAYMGHAYLVGFVDSSDTAARLQERMRGLEGVRTVDAYLPTKPADRSKIDDVEIEAKLKEALVTDLGQVTTRIESQSLAGHVVLLGVVARRMP